MAAAQTIERQRPRLLDSTPSDDAVVREYAHQLKQGEWGAESRVARELKCSRTHVVNVLHRTGVKLKKSKVKEAEAEAIAPVVPMVVPEYVPCPGEDEAREQHAKVAAKLAPLLETKPVLCQVELETQPIPETLEVMALPSSIPFQVPVIETPPVQIAIDRPAPVSNDYGKDAEWLLCVTLAVAIIMTACLIVTAIKAPLLVACVFPFALALWWVASQAAQNERYWSRGSPVRRETR